VVAHYIIQNPKLGLEVVPGKGRGVYALADIRRHEVLEHCPAIPIPDAQFDGMVMEHYVMPYAGGHAVVGGYAMFYNHDDRPNAQYSDEEWADGNAMVTLKAIKPIKAGDPITVHYGGGYSKVVFPPEGGFDFA
jgi:hypothetical protein